MTSKTDQASEQAVTEQAEQAEQAAAEQREAELSQAIADEEAQIGFLVSLVDRADRLAGKVWAAMGVRIDKTARFKAEQGEDWVEDAESMIPRSRPVIYKVRQAGQVLRVLSERISVPDLSAEQAEDLEKASEVLEHVPSYLTCLPWYRLLKEAAATKGDKAARDRAKRAAEAKILKAWDEMTEGFTRLPTVAESEAKASRFGAKGSAEDSSSEGSSDTNTPTQGEGTANAELTITLDAAGLESLKGDIGAQVKLIAGEHNIPVSSVESIMLAALRFGAERGYGNLTKVLGG